MAFKLLCNLNQHSLVHSGDKPYQCDECGTKFTLKHHLKNHLLSVHNATNLVSCRQQNCGVRVPKNELYKHIRTAHPKEKFQCNDCPMSFKTSTHLSLHERKHNGNTPYECEVCGKKFSVSSNYKRHTLLHTGNRPFKCDVCGKAFAQAVHMREHLKSLHSGDKPYPCSFCDKSFRASKYRNIHELSCSAKQ